MVSGTSDRVELSDYDPRWADLYAAEAADVQAVFGGNVAGVEHIGSTSIPGLAAKPIVDVLVGLRRLELRDDQIRAMEARGYEFKGEHGIPGRLFFKKREPHGYHVHVVEHGGSEWEKHLYFRDYLREHPQEAKAYEGLKRRLAGEVGHDHETYTESKTPFIRAAEARARRSLQPD